MTPMRNFLLAAAVAAAPSLALAAEPIAGAAAAGPAEVLPETLAWPSAVGDVTFPHAAHADDFGIECATCHHGTEAMALRVPHSDYFDDFWVNCATCHTGGAATAASKSCASCHPARPTRGAVEMPSVKVAIHRACWGCHEAGTGAEASAQCGICHDAAHRTPAVAATPPEG